MAKAKKKTKEETIKQNRKKPITKKKVRLSASMLKVWLTCPLQFHLNYIERLPQPANVAFSLGNSVHYALEQANISLIENPRILSATEVEEYVQVFNDYMAKTHVDSMEMFESGADMVRGELLNLAPDEKVIDTEVEFDITTPEGVNIYGFIDKVSQVDDTTIKITDYKTSKVAISWDEARVDEQLSMYDLAAAIMYPQFPKRILELKYVRSRQSVTSFRTEIAQMEFRRQISGIYSAIKEYFKERPDKRPEGTMHSNCHWCAYRKECSQYSQLVDGDYNTFVPITSMTDELAIEELQKISLRSKALDAYKDNIKLWVSQRIESDPETPVANNTHFLNPTCQNRRHYDASRIIDLLTPEQLSEVVSISSTKMSKLMNQISDPDLRREIENSAFVKVGNPHYRMKKL
jgi:RecB family exonuclease